MITNLPQVQDAVQTCGACPDQWEGHLIDGSPFYFRLRHGWARLDVRDFDAPKDVDPNTPHGWTGCGPEMEAPHSDGIWESEEECHAVFLELLARCS